MRHNLIDILVALIFIVIGCGGGGESSKNIKTANQISKIDFEGNLSDTYGYTTIQWNPGTPATVTYPAGHTGTSARTSHNTDDGGDDLEILYPDTWPASGERYTSMWFKYEANYAGLCTNGIWNVKWLWSAGTTAHNELIFQSYSGSSIGLAWQLSGGGTGWDGGATITKYGSASYRFGDWMHVEIYQKLSSGTTRMNADGVWWVKINGATVISGNNVVTGVPGRTRSPALKASCSCPAGQGWWQVDDYDVWDGIP